MWNKVIWWEYIVQIDETVICQLQLIFSLLKCMMICDIYMYYQKNIEVFIIKMVKDHKLLKKTKIIFKHVKICSLVITDGYKYAFEDFMCKMK